MQFDRSASAAVAALVLAGVPVGGAQAQVWYRPAPPAVVYPAPYYAGPYYGRPYYARPYYRPAYYRGGYYGGGYYGGGYYGGAHYGGGYYGDCHAAKANNALILGTAGLLLGGLIGGAVAAAGVVWEGAAIGAGIGALTGGAVGAASTPCYYPPHAAYAAPAYGVAPVYPAVPAYAPAPVHAAPQVYAAPPGYAAPSAYPAAPGYAGPPAGYVDQGGGPAYQSEAPYAPDVGAPPPPDQGSYDPGPGSDQQGYLRTPQGAGQPAAQAYPDQGGPSGRELPSLPAGGEVYAQAPPQTYLDPEVGLVAPPPSDR